MVTVIIIATMQSSMQSLALELPGMEPTESPDRGSSQMESRFFESTTFGAAIIRSHCYTRTNVLEKGRRQRCHRRGPTCAST